MARGAIPVEVIWSYAAAAIVLPLGTVAVLRRRSGLPPRGSDS